MKEICPKGHTQKPNRRDSDAFYVEAGEDGGFGSTGTRSSAEWPRGDPFDAMPMHAAR
jgi:hypothetical protein